MPRYIKNAPILSLQASDSNSKSLLKSGVAKIGVVVVLAFFRS